MASASSSTPFLEIRQENQMTQHQLSSTAASSTTAAPPGVVPPKKKRNQPGTPYPDAEVIALSPKTLMATNRFICEVCNKGFQREQNLQLHRRGHNLPWKLKQKTTKEPKRKVYLCPEPTCVHHDPSRALGDLTGIKKHYSRKHGEKKWKCDKCSKKYAVQSDWKAHSKTCGTREYRCDCGTLFSRRDSFITHRAFCDALAHESARHPSNLNPLGTPHLYGTTNHMTLGLSQLQQNHNTNPQAATNNNSILSLGNTAPPKYHEHLISPMHQSPFATHSSSQSPAFFITDPNQGFHHQDLTSQQQQGGGQLFSNKQLHGLMQLPDLQGTTTNNNTTTTTSAFNLSFFPNSNDHQFNNITSQGSATLYSTNNNTVGGSGLSSLFVNSENMSPHMSATALLQKAAQMGSTTTTNNNAVSASSLLRGMGGGGGGGSSSTNGADSDHHSNQLNNLATFGNDNRVDENEHHHHLRGLMNSFANGNTSMFGNVKGENSNLGGQFHQEPKKLSQNLGGVCFGGSDKLTLDFLGVGGMVRNMNSSSGNGGGFSQRDQQLHSMGTMSSLDPKMESTHGNQPFGSSTLQ